LVRRFGEFDLVESKQFYSAATRQRLLLILSCLGWGESVINVSYFGNRSGIIDHKELEDLSECSNVNMGVRLVDAEGSDAMGWVS
jgi:hypothetical protein